MDEYLTEQELLELLKISSNTAYRWRKLGMPYLKVGKTIRYQKEKVQEWLQKNTNNQT